MRHTIPAAHIAHIGLASLAAGIAAGLGGMALDLALHAIQHLAFGYDLTRSAPPETFLEGVTSAAPGRRLLILALCGLVAGVGWALVRRFGAPLVSVRAAIGTVRPGPPMPVGATVAHAVLQIITVALGSPLGREVAPREIGTLLADQVARLFRLGPTDARLILACGAGGGLAAVYNVPIAGTLFAIEVLLRRASFKAIILAGISSFVAAYVAAIGLGHDLQYRLPQITISLSLMAWALLFGPLFGLAASLFKRLTAASALRTPPGWGRIPWCLLAFTAIGAVATMFPALPGNGRGPAQLAFDGALGLRLVSALLVLKLAAIAASLRAGASGGLLTPSLTLGALMALPLGAAWSLFSPGSPPAAFALIGAAAFLATSLDMPLTAIALAMGFTHVDPMMILPLGLAVLGSITRKDIWVFVKRRL